MKIIKPPPTFQPITVVLESDDELRFLKALIRYSSVYDWETRYGKWVKELASQIDRL